MANTYLAPSDLSAYVPASTLALSITIQPSTASANEGATAVFSVTIANPLNLETYQWQKREYGSAVFANVSGATLSSYTTPTLVASTDDQDAYRVVVSNAVGAVTSDVAVLTVAYLRSIPSGALSAWGFRRVTNRSNCLRVRRSSDSAEQDIGFVGKWIDAASLLTFVGAGNGFVTKLYTDDAATDFAQATTANQPQIVASGSPVNVRYAATLSFDGTNDMLASADVAFGAQVTAIISLLSYGGLNKAMFFSGDYAVGSINNWIAPLSTFNSGELRVGTVNTGPTYELWDQSIAAPEVVGVVVDSSAASQKVKPVKGSTVSQTGWTNILSGTSASFSTAKIRIAGDAGGSVAAIQTRGFVVYPTAYNSAGLAAVSPAIGQYASGIVIGDSTVATFAGGTEIANFVHQGADYFRSHGINSIAVPGHTIAQQKTVWQSTAGRSYADWVVVQIGLNDCDPSIATATTIAAYQDLIATIRADNSTCKIIVATMTPAYERWPNIPWTQAAAQAKWQAINDAVSGLGASPITGVDARVTSHTPAISYDVGGFPGLAPVYDTGDLIHENNAARTIIGAAWRVALNALGVL